MTVKEIDKKIEELRKEIAKIKKHKEYWRTRDLIEEHYKLARQVERLKLKRNQTVWKEFGKEVRDRK